MGRCQRCNEAHLPSFQVRVKGWLEERRGPTGTEAGRPGATPGAGSRNLKPRFFFLGSQGAGSPGWRCLRTPPQIEAPSARWGGASIGEGSVLLGSRTVEG